MEQAAASALSGIFAEYGPYGAMLLILIVGVGWYTKTAKEFREERRGVIADLRKEIKELTTERDNLKSDLLDCQFPNRNGGVSNEPS